MAIQGKGDQVLLLQGTGHLLSPLQGARDHLSPQQGTGDQFLPLQGRGDQLEVSRRGAESPEAGQSSQERQFEPLRIALCTYFIIIMVLISNISFINDFRGFSASSNTLHIIASRYAFTSEDILLLTIVIII